MPRRVARIVALAVLSLVAVTSASVSRPAAQTVDPPVQLEVGRSIERALDTGAEHRYVVTLQQGEHAAVAALQRDLDVVIRVVGSDGTVLGEFDEELRNGREEQAELVAVASGAYTVSVRPAFRRASGSYGIRLAGTRAATDTDRTRQELRTLRAEYGRAVDLEAARPLAERALTMAEQTPALLPVDVAHVRRDLARILQRTRDYAGAVSHYEQVAATFETALGPDHPATAEAWTSLAASYAGLGQRTKADDLAQRALKVSEQALGPDHPQVALCLITLANLRSDAQDLDRSQELLRRALAIVDRSQGATLQMAVVLNNLGSALIARQQFAQADEFLRRSLQIREDHGAQGLDLAITLQNLGVIARERRDYAKAEDYYLRALSLRRRSLGPDHPDIALNLNNLATLYRAKGDVPRSLETLFEALGILEKNTGPYNTVNPLGNLARTYAAIDDVPHAIAFQRRVDAAIERQLGLQLATGSEREKLAVVTSLADRIERTISLDVGTRFSEPEATALAALVVLQRKGRILDAMIDTFAAVRPRLGSPEQQQALDRLSAKTRELTRLAFSQPRDATAAEHLAALRRLERERDDLESDLSRQSAAFRTQTAPVTLDAVRAALPDDAALIDFAVYRTFDPRAESNTTAYGAARYVAYVVTRQDTRGVDLGPASTIDAAVGAFRQALGDPQRTDVTVLARQLDAAVMQPVRGLVGEARHLLISPDGALNLIPFEALRDEADRYSVERYQISYLGSGRDLLRLQAPRQSRGEAVIVADPLTSADFPPLRGTAIEAQRLKALLPDATVLTRERATTLAVSQLEAPRVLHFATHGFFIQDPKGQIANPLLRSGLALSGASLGTAQGLGARSAGLLTALEAAHLDLWGTKLVTLSACDTGIGEIRNGEGVYGLRRAFFLAGAEAVVMSLWPVNDYVTRELMTAYYTGLTQGRGRGDALRGAQRAMLARPGRQHPFYWASFIQAGEWASLDGRR